ncbi:MAG: sigma-70 family RNA polymerase sigma factor [Bacteroidetes bacterium]|nr:sigma-70 family RNA polymerase sigma factor [Bacteroidota bacterium]
MRQLKISKQITNRESQSIEKYLQEISKVDLLSTEEEVELAKKVKQGDKLALEKLTKANLRFVVSVAKQYQNQGLFLNDLINEGNLGLMKAAIRFDETRGFKFISYAVWWIRQSILQSLAEHSRIVRLPANKVGALNKLNKTFAQLEQEFEREPTRQEIAEVLDIDMNDLNDFIKTSSKPVSIDEPMGEDEDVSMLNLLEDKDALHPEKGLMDESLKDEIFRILSVLTPRESEIISYSFGLNKEHLSFEEIGVILSLSRERVRQLKEKAIKKLRRANCSKLLLSYLG